MINYKCVKVIVDNLSYVDNFIIVFVCYWMWLCIFYSIIVCIDKFVFKERRYDLCII